MFMFVATLLFTVDVCSIESDFAQTQNSKVICVQAFLRCLTTFSPCPTLSWMAVKQIAIVISTKCKKCIHSNSTCKCQSCYACTKKKKNQIKPHKEVCDLVFGLYLHTRTSFPNPPALENVNLTMLIAEPCFSNCEEWTKPRQAELVLGL